MKVLQWKNFIFVLIRRFQICFFFRIERDSSTNRVLLCIPREYEDTIKNILSEAQVRIQVPALEPFYCWFKVIVIGE